MACENRSSNFSEALKKFSKWVVAHENKLDTACHCCPSPNNSSEGTNNIRNSTSSTPDKKNWKSVIEYHHKLQGEVESHGYLNNELKQFIIEDKTITNEQRDEAKSLENRWHNLWLKSLEQLVIVERTRRCPKHNTTIIGRPFIRSANSNKRLLRSERIRPLSYPNGNDRLEWDYKHTLSLTGCQNEGSQIDLDSVDEQATKSLTEFGENYELWFGKEDEIANISVHSRPPSVEPAERPETAKATVISTVNMNGDGNNLLMLTAPPPIQSIDGSKCSQTKEKQLSYSWRLVLSSIIVIIIVMILGFCQKPHQMQKSYYISQPPV